MSEKEIKKVSPRTENIIKGLFIVLFSIILAINVGKVARTFAFPLVYLFGVCYYFIVAYFIFIGLYRIIKHQKFKFKSFLHIVGLVLLFFGLVFTIGYISIKANGLTYKNFNVGEFLSGYNAQLGSYYSEVTLNLFASGSYWSNGLVGILLSGLVANDAIVLFLGIVLFVLAVASFALPFILKNKKVSKDKEHKEEAKEVEEDNNPVIRQEVTYPKVEKEPIEIAPGYESDREPIVNENSGFKKANISLDDAFISKQEVNTEYSEFSPLSFSNDPFNYLNPRVQNVEPVVQTPKVEEKVEEKVEVEEDINLVESRPIEPVSEENNIDESLVTLQPQFEEIVEEKEEPIVNEVTEMKKKKERVVWIPPSTDLLMTYETTEARELNEKVAEERVNAINQTLSEFKVGAKVVGYTIGPSVTRFNVEYEPNVPIKAVEKLEQNKDISRHLGGLPTRFNAVIKGEPYSGLEVPNATVNTVSFKEVFESLPDVKKHPLAVAFGKNISGEVIARDFDEFPHILVAGTTGSGKSIYTNSIITTLIMRVSPDDLKIILVDPKKVEMTKYRDMPHLLCPIITEAPKAKVCLQKLVEEMESRYEKFSENPEISNIKQYNAWAKEAGAETMPYIIMFVDEYADLVDECRDISQPLVRIAQKARAAGIHLLISTQSPRTTIITGVIKGNLPTHVALLTSSYTDSITIIGEGGAERLLGKGDMLVQSPIVDTSGPVRLQGCYIQNKEIVHVVNYLKEHYETNYDERFLDLVDHSNDPVMNALAPGEVEKESSVEEENKYQSIKEWVMSQEYVSMSKIQRECSVGFNRAGRFFSRLQKEGVVASTQDSSSKGCRVLIHDKFYEGDDFVSSDELID